MIKKYIEFIINENINLPELKSWNDLNDLSEDDKLKSDESISILIDEYCNRFEKKFLLTHEQINEVLLSLDLIEDLTFNIKKLLIRVIDGKDEGITEFNFRDEVVPKHSDIRGILILKRWYDEFIDTTIRPTHSVIIQKNPKIPFDNYEKIIEYLEMVKEIFEDMCDCNVILDKGGKYSIQLKIEYPETKIGNK